MFRRRTPPPPSGVDLRPGRPAVGRSSAAVDDPAAALAAAGWVLPRGLASDALAPSWTLVGTVASPVVTAVDRAGLVVGEGWSLDWWIGADDRWHLPAREAAVRQQLLGEAPVVETSLKIPGGDAVHRAYGVRSPRAVGDEWVVVEVENATPVPFAVALVLRPFVADGVGEASSITIEPVPGGQGREAAHLVRVDGRPAVLLPRRPARSAAGSAEAGDVAEVVTNGEAGQPLATADSADGLATLAMIFPLTHTSVLRVALPVGEVGEPTGSPLGYPAVLPDAATVAAGWDVHRRGPRLEVPERRLAVAVARARAQLQLAHDGIAV
ncbi:MAG TPA: hypothetical protein VHK88_13605, partial [Aquihabitans sp.]|nr:hypothetical protein [Aquihabitans sp.]